MEPKPAKLRDFVRGQSPAQIVATVNRCLDVHGAAPIDTFRVAFSPFDAFRQDVVGWVAAAVGRGAREVVLDLTHGGVLAAGGRKFIDGRALELPGELFRTENSLATLSLGRCGLRDVPPGAAGLAGLTSLSLSHVDVTDDAVRDMVLGCRLLEFLSLKNCHRLASVMIAGERLRGLEFVSCHAHVLELQVAAPALESFAFHGDAFSSAIEFIGEGDVTTPALREAYLSHLGFREYHYNYVGSYYDFFSGVVHAEILTICVLALMHIDLDDAIFEIITELPNLRDLQLLMNHKFMRCDGGLSNWLRFFEMAALPHLEHLFIRFPFPDAASDSGEAGEDDDIVLDYDVVFDQLSFIKVVNFRGTRCELRMLRFFLQRAPALEQLMMLVTPEEEANPGDADIKIIQGQVSTMPKASLKSNITVCQPREDRSQNPAHTTYYHEDLTNPHNKIMRKARRKREAELMKAGNTPEAMQLRRSKRARCRAARFSGPEWTA